VLQKQFGVIMIKANHKEGLETSKVKIKFKNTRHALQLLLNAAVL
jgi:hypothetical protein